jgi:hypoxanthine phosphoribosyltransferase
MRCAPSLIQPARIVMVDDVVTKGRTLLAAARRVREAFPNSEVKGFALIRYLGLVPDIESFKAPINGTIDLRDGDAERQP